MCLSKVRSRSISGLSRAFSTNGAMALTSCTSSSSAVPTSASGKRQLFSVAQVDLLQIRVERARSETAPDRSLHRSAAVSATCERAAERSEPERRSPPGDPLAEPSSVCRLFARMAS